MKWIFALSSCLFISIMALAQPPNDDAIGAITIAVGAGCSTLYTNVGATQSANELLASCSDDPANPVYTGQHIVWFKFTAPPSGAIRISTDNGQGTLHDTQIALYSATDSSDYNTFQIIACDDDNGYRSSVASILYAAGLVGGETYYVLVDGWQPRHIGTFCLTIDEIDSSMLSTTNTCSSGYPSAWGGSTSWPINPEYKGWISLVDNQGKIVANVRDTSGGFANAFTSAQTIHHGTVRKMPNGTYYLDRNYLIHSVVFAANVNIQFFFLNSEFNALNAASGGNFTIHNLHVIQQDTTCQTDYATNVPSDTLPQSGCSNEFVGTANGVSWVTATTPGFPPPGYANFYLIPGTSSDTLLTTISLIKSCFHQPLLRAIDTSDFGYIWNDGTTGMNHFTDSSGTWWVSYDSGCTHYVDTFNVQVTPLPVLSATRMSCLGGSNGGAKVINAPGDSTLFTYTWLDVSDSILRGPLQSDHGDTLYNVSAGKYLLKIKSPEGCDTLLVVKVPAHDFKAAFDVSDTFICKGDTITFQNTSKGLDFFQWSFGDGGSATLGSPKHSFSNPGSYIVQLIGQSADPPCYDTVEKTITVDRKVPNIFQIVPDSICVGTEAIVLIPQTDSTIESLHWDFGDGTDMNNGIRERRIQHAYDIAGKLRIALITHFRACPDTSFSDTVYVYALPKINLGPDTGLCLNGTPILLHNLQNLSGDYHQLWSTGDTTERLKVVHPGIYSLTVKTEPLGCSNTAFIKIAKDCYIDIPNAFTPNGDGVNDYFFPRQLLTQKVAQFKMQVFNRWGELIFETTKINGRGWDGKFNGKPQPEGVYVYLVDTEIDGIQEHYQGNVTLLQ